MGSILGSWFKSREALLTQFFTRLSLSRTVGHRSHPVRQYSHPSTWFHYPFLLLVLGSAVPRSAHYKIGYQSLIITPLWLLFYLLTYTFVELHLLENKKLEEKHLHWILLCLTHIQYTVRSASLTLQFTTYLCSFLPEQTLHTWIPCAKELFIRCIVRSKYNTIYWDTPHTTWFALPTSLTRSSVVMVVYTLSGADTHTGVVYNQAEKDPFCSIIFP